MCMVEMSDGPCTVLHEGQPVARKEHRCSECKRTISIGETYLLEKLVFDGEFSTHRTCKHCNKVREWLNAECGGWLYGGVAEDINEHAQEGAYGLRVKMMAVGIDRQWTRKDGKLWRVPPVGEEA